MRGEGGRAGETASWIDDEPDLRAALRELQRLLRRAAARPIVTLLLALLTAAGVAGNIARKQLVYDARVVFRVTESDFEAGTAPPPARALRAYVLDVAFSSARLLEVMRAHHLYGSTTARDPTLALESMREDIEVQVWRNYFIQDRAADEAGRSAHLAIGYTGTTPEQALAVVHDLGRLVIEQELAMRAQLAEEAVRRAEQELQDGRERVAALRGQMAANELAARRATPENAALLRLEIQHLQRQTALLDNKLRALEQARTSLGLRLGLEQRKLGLTFELVDPGRAPRLGWSRSRRLLAVFVLVFLLCLPLTAMAAAAFDPRVYDAEDLARLGLSTLGQVATFPGDGALALRERLRRDPR
jgi:hypothetical protein